MKTPIVCSQEAITLVGGGAIRAEDLNLALRHAPTLVAADRGAVFAVGAGHMPEAVVGDMDSLPEEVREQLPPARLYPFEDQDTTDFDKALRSVEAPLVLGVGFLGGRVDHELANLNVLVRRPEPPCVLIGAHDVVLGRPRHGSRVEPSARHAGCRSSQWRSRGRSRGLHWPIDGLRMSPDGFSGTSNRVEDGFAGAVELLFDVPGMLLILPRAALGAVLRALGR